jgi:hypothetical protein
MYYYASLHYHYSDNFEMGQKHTLKLPELPILPLLLQCHQQYELFHPSLEHAGYYPELGCVTVSRENWKMMLHTRTL